MIASGRINRYDTTSDALVRRKTLLVHRLIMPNSATDEIMAKYAASTSYNETPPNGRQSITIGSDAIIKIARCASDANSLPSTIAPGRNGLASSIS